MARLRSEAVRLAIAAVAALLACAGGAAVVGTAAASRPLNGLAPVSTPSKGCSKPVPPCTAALDELCGDTRKDQDECERCAGEHDGALRKAGCSDKEIDALCAPCLPLNCHREQHRLIVDDPVHGLLERHYRVHLPPSYKTGKLPHAVVIDFHGYYLWDWADEEITGLNEVADLRSFITVYPQGMDDITDVWTEGEGFSWNAAGTTGSPGRFGPTCEGNHSAYACYKSCQKLEGHSCNKTNTSFAAGCDSSTCVDDILFVEKMLDQIESDYCINLERIHLTGISNGAMMVYALAMSRLAHRFGGVVPVEGAPLLGFLKTPSFPIALLDVHGTQDGIIPANRSGPIPPQCGVGPGPHGSVISNDGFYYTTQQTISQTWAAGPNHCTGAKTFITTPWGGANDSNFTCWAPHGDCENGALLRCTHNAGHIWPFYGYLPAINLKYAELVWCVDIYARYSTQSPVCDARLSSQQRWSAASG
jgi:poly(3-hydroxybutyrate) depolymerase